MSGPSNALAVTSLLRSLANATAQDVSVLCDRIASPALGRVLVTGAWSSTERLSTLAEIAAAARATPLADASRQALLDAVGRLAAATIWSAEFQCEAESAIEATALLSAVEAVGGALDPAIMAEVMARTARLMRRDEAAAAPKVRRRSRRTAA